MFLICRFTLMNVLVYNFRNKKLFLFVDSPCNGRFLYICATACKAQCQFSVINVSFCMDLP